MTRLKAEWLRDPRTQAVLETLGDAGAVAYVVGGCVRNTLLDVPVSDIDIATSLMPQDVMDRATAAGHKAIPTGIEFGTVTVVVNDTPFEITTFRRDIETDGRHAVVAFSEDVAEDAARRDFTMNALYADADGGIIDPVNGLPDLKARRLRFVGRPEDRIHEDYLRSLRYFRFFAYYADDARGFDPDAISAIASTIDGLERLSAERVGHEMRRLLAAPDPSFAVAGMSTTGALAKLLPGSDAKFLGPLVHQESALGLEPSWIRRLAVLGGSEPSDRLRLSRSESKHLEAIDLLASSPVRVDEAAYRYGPDAAIDAALSIAAVQGDAPENLLEDTARGASARFPVSARDLDPALKGPAIGEALRLMEQRWIDSDFTLTRDQLLA